MNREIESAKGWILYSGIQNSEELNAGGFNSWFDMDGDSYPYLYSEITGYGITTLLYLGRRFGDEECLERAVSAAEWLMSSAAHSCGGVKTRRYNDRMAESDLYSFESEVIYAFDNGMVLYGMANLYKQTKESKYLEFAVGIADFLIGEMITPEGLFFASLNAKTGDREDSPRKWSSQSGSYHAKIALGLVDLFDITKNERYKNAVLKLCRRCMDFQDGPGRFVTSRADNSTHLHPHSYSAEGLLYAGIYFGEDEFIESAHRAVKWALDNQCPDGGVPKKFNGEKFIPYYRSDVLAQVLRLGVVLSDIGKLGEKYLPRLEMLRDKLLAYQFSGKGRQAGGFYYGTALDGLARDHINSWCTMFAAQALVMYDDLKIDRETKNRMECFV
ncbi:MAG: glycoside hydrolase family 76 protein [Candidatus Omnitrophota bacterium]|jgi:uncharacterized protein YyaL (SSP411 family)